MFKNYLKVAFRNLWKNKGYSVINILGLSIGLAVCLLIFLFIRYELSFDTFHKNGSRIYRVVSSWQYANGTEHSEGTPLPLPDAMRQDFPEFETVAAVMTTGRQITIPGTGSEPPKKFDETEKMFYVQPQFYKIFNFPWLAGNPESLKEPNTVALTQLIAEKFFGDWHKAIGRTIIKNNQIPLRIIGVIQDPPNNTDLSIPIAISYSTYTARNTKSWSSVSSGWQTYIVLKRHTDIKQAAFRLPAFVKKYIKDNSVAEGTMSFHFQPLNDIHFNQEYGAYGHQINKAELIAFGLVGLFILLIACINFINIATAQAVSRSKEVGIRKVLGSRRLSLVLQFIGETMLTVLFAAFLACIIVELALPPIQKLLDQPIAFNILQYPIILPFALIIVVLTGIMAGFYPALIMSGFDPATALKSKINQKHSGGVEIRGGLVIAQFTITLILVVSTLIIIKQMNFFRKESMGFDQSAITLVDLPNDSLSIIRYSAFKAALLQVPGIQEVSFCYAPPSSNDNNRNNITAFNGKELSPALHVNIKFADTGYFSTFGLHFVAGRAFGPSDTIKDYVINETLLRKLDLGDPQNAIGKYLTDNGFNGKIVGVINDFVNKSLKDNIDPLLITTLKTNYEQVALRLHPANIQQTMKAVKAQYDKIFPEYLYNSSFYDKDIADYYIEEVMMAKLFKIFALIVFLISFIGLVSLLSFIIAQKRNEIAVRKVLGASDRDILKLLGKSFILKVVMANILAFPIAYLLAQKWLNGFAYRISIPALPFIIAAVSSVVLTFAIVCMQVMGAAKANPVDALKYE